MKVEIKEKSAFVLSDENDKMIAIIHAEEGMRLEGIIRLAILDNVKCWGVFEVDQPSNRITKTKPDCNFRVVLGIKEDGRKFQSGEQWFLTYLKQY